MKQNINSDIKLAFLLVILAIGITLALTKPTITGAQTQCSPNWQCGTWTICSLTGTQTRTCNDSNNCGNNTNKPAETQNCTAPQLNLKGDIIVAAENMTSGAYFYLTQGDKIQRKQRAKTEILVLYEKNASTSNIEIRRILMQANKELENATQTISQDKVYSANNTQIRQFKAGEINGTFFSAQFNTNPHTEGKLQAGEYKVKLIIDPNNAVPETDETDNTKEFAFEVRQIEDTTESFSKTNVSIAFLSKNATKSANIQKIPKSELRKKIKELFRKSGYTPIPKQPNKKEKKIAALNVTKRYTSIFRSI